MLPVVLRIVLVDVSDGGGQVKESRVEQEEEITRHACTNNRAVVELASPPVVRYPAPLDKSRGNEDTQHTVEMLPLETPDPAPVRLRNPRHLRFAAPQPLLLVSRLLMFGGVNFLRAEADVSVGLEDACGRGQGGRVDKRNEVVISLINK